VREEAAKSLGAAGDRRAVPALVASLSDGDGGVRTRAVNSLGELGDPQAIRPLLAMLLNEEDPFRVTNIQRSLKRLGTMERIAVRE
jgi:HEAT repeat protein